MSIPLPSGRHPHETPEQGDQGPKPYGPPSSLHLAHLSYRSSALIQKQLADSDPAITINSGSAERSVIDLLACSEISQRYLIDRKIGQGGMGSVYRAVDRDLAREVALKVLDHAEKDARSRFATEAQIAGQLEHPNIVPIHELGVNADGRLFFTLKLIKGMSLRQLIDELRDNKSETITLWPLAKLLRAFIAVCNAIAFSHHHRVLHRDLKPSNILLGSFGEVLVTDWGCAKCIGPHLLGEDSSKIFVLGSDPEKTPCQLERNQDATLDGLLVGTPLYMSPEQARGDSAQLDERSDIYSLGATLYEIVTLEHAIPGTRINDVLTNVRRSLIVPPHERTPDRAIPSELSAIIMKAVSGKRECRYPTVEELRNDIERFLDHRSVSVKDDSVWELIAKILKRNKTASITAGVFSGLLVLVMTTALILNVRERRNTENAFQRYRASEMERSTLIAKDFYERQRAWVPVLREDFSDDSWENRWDMVYGMYETRNSETWFVNAEPRCHRIDGTLRIKGGLPQLLFTKESYVGDVAVEFDCTQPGPRLGDISCIIGAVRKTPPNLLAWTGYTLQFGAYDNTRNLVTRNNGSIHRDGRLCIERARRYRIRGEREGRNLRLIIDNDTLFDVVDPYPLYGSHRDVVGIFGYISEQILDNIVIYRKGAAQKEDLLDVADRFVCQDSLDLARVLYQQVLSGTTEQARVHRAKRGLTRIAQRENLIRSLPVYNKHLRNVWPRLTDQFRINEDGLLLHIGVQFPVPSLRPLSGIPISNLAILNGPRDLSLAPLSGMPLKNFHFSNYDIDDLGPLKNMPLETLEAGCSVKDLSPLSGMPLSNLKLQYAPVSDLNPLRGMHLATLDLQLTGVGDLSPLAGQPLRELHLGHTLVEDLSPLTGMNLGILEINQTRVSSLEPLRDMGLFELHCCGTHVSDLSALKNCPLRQLRAADTRITSVAPLSRIPLSILDIANTRVKDISSLTNANLTELNISFTDITSLHPIRNKEIRDLKVYGIPLSEENISVIRQLPLWSIEADLSNRAVRTHIAEKESLISINGFRIPYMHRVLQLYEPNQQHHPHPEEFRKIATRSGRKKYAAIPLRLTWAEADSFCRAAGGVLASPATQEESDTLQKYLRSTVQAGTRFLFGLELTPEGLPAGWRSGAALHREFWKTESERLRCIENRGVGQVVYVTGENSPWLFMKGSAPLYFVVEWQN